MFNDDASESFLPVRNKPSGSPKQDVVYCNLILLPPMSTESEDKEAFLAQLKTGGFEIHEIKRVYEVINLIHINAKAVAFVDIDVLRFISKNDYHMLEAVPNYCIDVPFSLASGPWATVAAGSILSQVPYRELLSSAKAVHKKPSGHKIPDMKNATEVSNPLADLDSGTAVTNPADDVEVGEDGA